MLDQLVAAAEGHIAVPFWETFFKHAEGGSGGPWVRGLWTDLPMQFVGGFVGVAQDDATLAVTPAIGWAVRGAG